MTADRPVGPEVDASPASRPGPVVLDGRFGRVEKLDPAHHGAALWDAFRGDEALWTYMSQGPFAAEGAFAAWLEERARLTDPFSYALVEIRPAMRVIEVGHVLYGGALQRTPLATEAQYLLARYAFETLSVRRYEWKCNALNAPSRRSALR